MNMLTILLDAAEAQPQRGGSMASTLIFMLLTSFDILTALKTRFGFYLQYY